MGLFGSRCKTNQDQDTSQLLRSVCLFCAAAQVHPPCTCPLNRTPTPTAATSKTVAVLTMAKSWPTLLWCLLVQHHPLAPAWHHPPPLAPAQEVTRAGLPGLAPMPAPMEPASQPLLAGWSGEEVPSPAPPPSPHPACTRRPPLAPLTSSVVSALTTEGASLRPCNRSAKSGYRTCTQHPKPGARCQPLPRRRDWGGGSTGGARAIAGPSWWGLGSGPTTPP